MIGKKKKADLAETAVKASERPEQPVEESVRQVPALRAKRNFHIRHNDYERVIAEGDDLSDVPERYHQNLKTEGVI